MISPEKYYEEYLKGKTAVQIMTAIRGLKNLIGHQRHRNIYPIYGQAFLTTIKHFAAVTKKIWRVTEKNRKVYGEAGCTGKELQRFHGSLDYI